MVFVKHRQIWKEAFRSGWAVSCFKFIIKLWFFIRRFYAGEAWKWCGISPISYVIHHHVPPFATRLTVLITGDGFRFSARDSFFGGQDICFAFGEWGKSGHSCKPTVR